MRFYRLLKLFKLLFFMAKKKPNYFEKFLNGDLSLPHSYWVVGWLISFAFGFTVGFISIALTDNLGIGYVAIVIWQVFITIGIWRSSDKYKGPKYWAYLAKIMVVVGWGYLLAELGAL
jgi:hypothetical protein